ncbi:MAG: ABC transporter ATP-binding protein [Bacteroidetes bacterium]|nr:MAG: ABC transporter ATP-binding protein [Bacteroidota bacterium]TAG85583.1 MAG: ABC transporter ATP-binding protein [Bacteroidota bacterium]
MILLQHISKSYKTQKVLSDVNLDIPKGTIQALLGANGAGKSTLINIISCLMPCDSGKIYVDDEEINLEKYDFRAKIGYVFEKPIYIEKLSAQEFFYFVANMHKIPKIDIKQRISDLLDFFELPKDNKKMIEQYSKGMKSKVSLASALIHKPEYLILDEPFDGLDFLSVQKISTLLKNMAKNNTTIFITSHQYDIIADVCDTFALLKEGQIKFNKTMLELEQDAKAQNFENVKTFLESILQVENSTNELDWLK